ncbi:F-box only protein 22 [Tetranychus urticae]|uniref:FIST C-domain domain-containing protein n=1 Tax=Tetranychus urticae TaxID=32264 RepID=T1KB58_TETUR|nr:F-box only protein 22 [Tetranychus urticae]
MTSNSVAGEDVLSQVILNDLLVQTILDNLSAKQLSQSKSVCHRWSGIVKNIVKNRTSYETFLSVICPKGFESSGNQDNEKEKKAKKIFLDLIKKSPEILKSENEQSMFQSLDAFFSDQLQSFPELGILFVSSTNLIRKLSQKNYFPPSCRKLYICSRAGIIGKSSLTSKPLEFEKFQFKVNAIAGCFVKKQWGDFKITITDWDNKESPEPDVDDANYPICGLLIFSINFEEGKRFNSFLDKQTKPIAIGGALVDKIWYQGQTTKMLTMTFAGKNVKSASFVLDTKTVSEAHCELTHFKNCLDFDVDAKSPNIRTIGFIFICAARGAAYYQGDLNVESDLLHSIFPNVMFSGVFGNGEYGWDCYNKTDCDQDTRSLSQPNLAQSFTSVIVLVQFVKS